MGFSTVTVTKLGSRLLKGAQRSLTRLALAAKLGRASTPPALASLGPYIEVRLSFMVA